MKSVTKMRWVYLSFALGCFVASAFAKYFPTIPSTARFLIVLGCLLVIGSDLLRIHRLLEGSREEKPGPR